MDESLVLAQQSDLLRDIRDEMRSMRAGSPVGSATSYGEASQRVQKQAFADKIAANQLSSFDWKMGTQTLYQPSLVQDALGVTGFGRSPASMTQPEYQSLASENLGLRYSSLFPSVFAPNFAARTSSLAESIYANSPRFSRFGTGDSIFGAGLSRTSSVGLAGSINTLAAGDIRLSVDDYAGITKIGMAGGQFDDISGGAGEFKARLTELANATSQLTRQLRTSADDISKAMSSIRTLGVSDIGSQQRILSNAGAFSQVAGISLSEMLSTGQAVARAGLTLGMNAEASFGLAASNAASVRALRPAGLISDRRIASGGGVLGVATSIAQFEQQALSSDAGFLALVGKNSGVGGGAIDQALGGLQTVAGGGLYGALGYQMNRSDIIGSATAEDASYAARSMLEAQIRMAGVRDMRSTQAQSVAYGLLRGQGLDDASAFSYAKMNFSEAGVLARDRTRFQSVRAKQLAKDKEAADLYYTTHSSVGQFRQGMASAGQSLSGFLERRMTPTQTGLVTGHLGNDLAAGAAGLLADSGTLAGRMAALGIAGDINNTVTAADIYDPVSASVTFGAGVAASSAMGIGGIAMGVAGGAALLAGSIATGGLLLGGAVAAGYFAGDAFDFGAGLTNNRAWGLFGDGQRRVTGDVARDYLRLQRAVSGPTNSQRASEQLSSARVANSSSLKKLLSSDLTSKSADSSLNALGLVQAAALETGLSQEDIANLRMSTGMGFGLASGSVAEVGGYDVSGFKKSMSALLGSGDANTVTANFGMSENAGAVRRYLESLDAEGNVSDAKAFVESSKALASIGITEGQAASLRSNYANMSAKDRAQLISGAKQFELMGGSRAANRDIRSLADYADMTLSGSSDDRAGVARDELGKIMSSGDLRGLLGALNSDTTLSKVLQDNDAVFRSMANVSSVSDLKRMSARDLASKYGVDRTSAAEALSSAEKTGNWEGLRQSLQLAVGQMQTEGEGGTEVRVANLLKQASVTLERVNATLDKNAGKAK